MSGLLGWESPPVDEEDERKSEDDAVWYAYWQELLRLEARAAEEEGAALWSTLASATPRRGQCARRPATPGRAAPDRTR